MIIKIIASKPKPKGVERYARHLASYLADGDRHWLRADAIGMDYGLTLSAYMTSDKKPEPPRERVLYRGAWTARAIVEWDEGLSEVERRLTRRSRKVKMPVRHGILSCRAEESLSEDQCVDAVATMAKELGCEDAVILWAAHVDTDNFHIHAMFVTVDSANGTALPFGQQADGSAGYKEALQRAIARIEHAHHLQPENGSRYEIQDGEPVRKPVSRPIERKRAPLRQEVLEWEETSGFASLTRYAQDVAGPILDEAESWNELHRALAPHGLQVAKAVNGGVLQAGEEQVKLSSVDRRHSWAKLKERLGGFEPAADIEVTPYTPRVRDHAKAARWLERSQRLRKVSEQVDQRVAALIAARDAALAEIATQMSAHQADMAQFDGDLRLSRDLASAWPRLRAAATAAVKSAFGARIDAVRALRRAAATCDDLGAVDTGSLGRADAGIVAPWHADRAPTSPATLPGFDGERRGEVVCYWSRDDLARRQPAFVDADLIIWVNDHDDRTVDAVLRLARNRFGAVAVFGDKAYLRQCREAADRLGIDIEEITVREAERRARRTRQLVESARRRAVDVISDRSAAASAQRRDWARAYQRAAAGEAAVRDEARSLAGLPHHTAIETASALGGERAAPIRETEPQRKRLPIGALRSPDRSI